MGSLVARQFMDRVRSPCGSHGTMLFVEHGLIFIADQRRHFEAPPCPQSGEDPESGEHSSRSGPGAGKCHRHIPGCRPQTAALFLPQLLQRSVFMHTGAQRVSSHHLSDVSFEDFWKLLLDHSAASLAIKGEIPWSARNATAIPVNCVTCRPRVLTEKLPVHTQQNQ